MSDQPWLTPADLESAQALADAATPGPWVKGNRIPNVVTTMGYGPVAYVTDRTETDTPQEADAAFIAAARTLVPALLHRIRFQHDKAIRAQEFWEGKIRGLQRDVDSFRFMFSSQCAKTERAEALLEEIRALAARSAGSASSTHYELRALLERHPA
ncbi:MAG: hypothetical protein EOP28_02400 [Rhodococcus sp. (in: high G+C Gram-positive bacteria)]|nr:MAG: hypothetical protein EOP28_02400 [Rhodococcus sp. (in: high G+C Gram-positive bacteria)]